MPLVLEHNGEKIEVQIMPAPLTWWGQSLLPTPTLMNPAEPFDYL